MARHGRTAASGAVLGLALLAAVQTVGLVVLRGGPAAGAPTLGPGFDFSGIRTAGEDGAVAPLVRGRPTLVFVFHSRCGHCRVVAPLWADWLASRPADLDVVAVTKEPHDVGAAYAGDHGWDVDVRSVVVPLLGSAEHALTSKTPWVFGLDAGGRVAVGAHGSEVAFVADRLRTGR